MKKIEIVITARRCFALLNESKLRTKIPIPSDIQLPLESVKNNPYNMTISVVRKTIRFKYDRLFAVTPKANTMRIAGLMANATTLDDLPSDKVNLCQ